MRFVLSLLLVASVAPSVVAAEHTTIIHAGTLLAVPGAAAKNNQSIIVVGNRISRVEDGFVPTTSVAADATLIDLSDEFVLPGRMDMHLHLLQEIGPKLRTANLYVATSMQALKGAMHAKRTPEAGFTTVRDLSGIPEAIYALRDAINNSEVPGPRVIDAGSALAATGGHGNIDSVEAELLEMSDSLGTIEPGKLADMVAVDGNPLDDKTALENVSLVIKDGKQVN